MQLIKKYSNRKLYNSSQKQYVTLEEIAELVRKEVAFLVLDNATGVDITADILKQVIAQSRKDFSVPLLAGLIRAGTDRLTGLGRGVQARLDSSGLLDLAMDRRITQLVEQGIVSESEATRMREVLLRDASDLATLLFDVPTRDELLLLATHVEQLTQVVQNLNKDLREEK